jgi:hypothetical protein
MTKTEIALLCKVFLQDFESEPSDLAQMYQEAVSENESDWIDFLDKCKELSHD